MSVILYGFEIIVVSLKPNTDIDFCTAGNDLVAIRNFSFGDSSLRIPDNSVGTRVFLRRNIQQNITVCIRGHINGVIAALNVIFFVCKRRRVFSFNILQVDNELLFICCNSAAGRTAAGNAAPGAAPAGFTAAGAVIFSSASAQQQPHHCRYLHSRWFPRSCIRLVSHRRWYTLSTKPARWRCRSSPARYP